MRKRALVLVAVAVGGAPPLAWALVKLWRAAQAHSAFDLALGLLVLVAWLWFAVVIGRAVRRRD